MSQSVRSQVGGSRLIFGVPDDERSTRYVARGWALWRGLGYSLITPMNLIESSGFYNARTTSI